MEIDSSNRNFDHACKLVLSNWHTFYWSHRNLAYETSGENKTQCLG